MDEHNWHIFRVSSGHEVAAAQASNVLAYVPRKRVTYFNRRLRKMMCHVRPALPGFVFMRVDNPIEVKMPPLRQYHGFMRNPDRSFSRLNHRAFRQLCDMEAELLKIEMGEDVQVFTQIAAPEDRGCGSPFVVAGAAVEITEGPWENLAAIVKEMRGNRVLLELIGSQLRIEAEVSKLRAA